MPISKNHNKKECHSKKRKRYARYKFDQERKWKAMQQVLLEERRSRMDKHREKFTKSKEIL